MNIQTNPYTSLKYTDSFDDIMLLFLKKLSVDSPNRIKLPLGLKKEKRENLYLSLVSHSEALALPNSSKRATQTPRRYVYITQYTPNCCRRV